MKKSLQILILICFSGMTMKAQVPTHQDCRDAIPICGLTYTEVNSYTGTGNYTNEVNPGNTACSPSFSETNSCWYIVTVQTSGTFGFLLTPTNLSANFNWAVYDQTGSYTCSNIYTNSALALACNTDATPGLTGMCGGTGPQFGSMISVTAGKTFVICISDMNGTGGGFTLDFSCSTTQISDNIVPHMASIITPVACNSTSLQVRFTENVTCSSVTPSEFTITDALNNVQTVSSITSNNCSIGSPYDNVYTLTFSPSITQSGNYILHFTGGVSDLCGNVAVAQTLPFNVAGVTIVAHAYGSTCTTDGWASASIVSGLGPYTYSWSPSGGTTQTVSNLSPGYYTCTVHGASGCPGVAICQVRDTNLTVEQLCIVTVDISTQKNMLVWNKTYNAGIAYYNILKETTTAGVYALLANQAFNTFSTYIDNSSQPQVVAARYKLQTIDSCNGLSDSGIAHKTIHLTVNQGIGNSWNLIWDAYEGISFPTYYILRGTVPNNLSVLDSVQSTIFTYTDLNPPSGLVYYAIEVVGNSLCSPSVPIPHQAGNNLKSLNGTHSRSNVTSGITTGIIDINNKETNSIYPNPASNTLTIRKELGITNYELRITDVLGNMVYSQGLMNATETTIDISQLSGGIYFYEVRSGLQTSASVRGKFVKE